jgi:hypothetical protein
MMEYGDDDDDDDEYCPLRRAVRLKNQSNSLVFTFKTTLFSYFS